MKKKSIVFVVHNMNIGGTEKSLLSLINTLDRSKYSVTILMLEKYGGYLNAIPSWVNKEYVLNYKNIKNIITLPPLKTIKNYLRNFQIKKCIYLGKSYLVARFNKNWDSIYKFASKEVPIVKFDIAVAYAGPSDFITFLVSEKIIAKDKIQWIHFDVPRMISNPYFGNKYYPNFNKILCVSAGARTSFINIFPGLNHKTEIFENIISEEEIIMKAEIGESFNDNFEGIKILTVGRLTEEKGHKFIPEIVKNLLKLTEIDFRWYIIGDGIEKEVLKNQIDQFGVSSHIKLLGLKSNPYRFMKDCEIYVQPSLHEGYGLTVAEAKVFNKPILISNFASSENLIESWKTGIIASTDVNSLTTNLFYLFDEANRFKFSKNLAIENSRKSRVDSSNIF